MTDSSDELVFVTIDGSALPHTHAVLIETAGAWHVELEGVPVDSCPLVQAECSISFDTPDGTHYVGTVTASFATEDVGYVLLTGVGELRRGAAAADVARD